VSITQGAFSYLPPLTDEEIRMQVQRAIDLGWAVSIEFTDDPAPRNHYWRLWGQPVFDDANADDLLGEINRCREAFPDQYVKVNALDSSLGRQTIALSFLVQHA